MRPIPDQWSVVVSLRAQSILSTEQVKPSGSATRALEFGLHTFEDSSRQRRQVAASYWKLYIRLTVECKNFPAFFHRPLYHRVKYS